MAVIDRPSCLAREDGRRSPGRLRRRWLLPRVEVEQQRTGRREGRVGTICTRAAFVLHLLQKRALAAGAGGGAAVLAHGCAGARRRRGSRELSSLVVEALGVEQVSDVRSSPSSAFVRSPRVPYPLGLLSNDSFPDLLGCLHLLHLLIPLFLTRKVHPLSLPH